MEEEASWRLFITVDTTRYTKFHRELTAKGAIVNADLKFIDKYRKKIRREYASFDKFKTRFETPQELIDLVLAEGEKAGVKPKDEEELQKTLPELKLQMKALLHGTSGICRNTSPSCTKRIHS